ncbi:hypothetical protein BVI1335_120026 [Burkholderia vietnamiensis]|nr:hypothetical protein BVI1335_120026 [Burkholderia vietnamiensis]
MENLVESRPPGPVGWLTGWLAYKQTFVACSEAIERISLPIGRRKPCLIALRSSSAVCVAVRGIAHWRTP